MIQEEYVSFETAKLLKEKGFGECSTSYISEDGDIFPTPLVKRKEHYPAPTQQMAMRWLLLNYDFFITVVCNNNQDLNFSFEIYEKVVEEHDSYWYKANVVGDNNFNAPEAAIEAALKYCLENYI